VYEAARAGDDDNLRFAEVPYGIETGEAERIAVDGVSRGTDSDSAGELATPQVVRDSQTDQDSRVESDHAAKCYSNAS
jgi:hypothetical protein